MARFRRWCKRNPAVASLTSTVALLLLAAAVVSTIAAIKFDKLADEKAALAGNLKGALDEAERNMEFARRQERQPNDNRQLATAEQKRAEGNLDLAMQSLNDVYLQAIGWNRLLGDTDPLTGKQKSTPQEKKILKSGLKFYVQLANQNENSSRPYLKLPPHSCSSECSKQTWMKMKLLRKPTQRQSRGWRTSPNSIRTMPDISSS